jgi:hypothetical protein
VKARVAAALMVLALGAVVLVAAASGKTVPAKTTSDAQKQASIKVGVSLAGYSTGSSAEVTGRTPS